MNNQMNIIDLGNDILSSIIIKCNIEDFCNLYVICQKFKTIIDDDYLWKEKFTRDYRDIHKLNDESWKQYYKRRMINHGIPLRVSKNDTESSSKINRLDSITGNNIIKYFRNEEHKKAFWLTKDNRAYILNEDQSKEIGKNLKIKDIYGIDSVLYLLIDENNDLYMDVDEDDFHIFAHDVIRLFDTSFLDDGSLFCYSTSLSTRKLSIINQECIDEEIFNFPIIDYGFGDEIQYVINIDKNLCCIGKNNKLIKLSNLKFIKISASCHDDNFIILSETGYIHKIFVNKNLRFQFPKLNIPHIKNLNINSFITENGDLCCFSSNGIKLLCRDVVYANEVRIINGNIECYCVRKVIH